VAKDAETEQHRPRQVGRLEGRRLLVVDDNETNRRILVEMIRSLRMNPTAVPGAAEAVDALRAARDADQPFSLVVSDAQMPLRDGYQLIDDVRRDKDLADTPVIMLTSADQAEEIEACRRLGVAAHLVKPVKLSELFDAIALALGVAETTVRRGGGRREPVVELPPLDILLAEDSEVNQRLAVAMLEKHGHQVQVAATGHEVLSACSQHQFDLILMDVQMPEMDGLEATAAIRMRERQTGGHVPIVAMTAHALKGDREKCLAAGMDDYVAKPIHIADVFSAMASALKLASRSPAGRKSPESSENGRGAATAPPVIDGAVDWPAAFHSVKGDSDLLRDVVEAALEEVPRQVAAIREAGQRQDAAAMRLAAHGLKGAVRYFGEVPLYETSMRIESHAAQNELDAAGELLPALAEQADAVCAALRDYQQQTPAEEAR
jgi:CheY-like chemotaxis protein/HPt (histidine-containing phosphotransfer) domain-containing protein